jgi:hypothetical protein
MVKQSGLGDALFAAGYDLSGDIGSLGKIAGGPSTLDVTGIDKSAMERVGGRRDGGIDFTAFFNPASDQAHPRLSALPTTDQIVTYCRGTALGSPAAACVAKQIDYAGTRGDDGGFTFAVQAQANGYGLEWGQQHTAGKRTDASAANGTPVDYGAVGLAFGLQAYLHVFSVGSGTVTVKLQESSDNGADAYTDVAGGGFAAATGITSERIATSPTLSVERYLRVTTTGVFTDAVFSVVVARNLTATIF